MPETSIPLGGIHLKLLRLSLETRALENLEAIDSQENLELLENLFQSTIVISQDCMFK